MEGVGAGEVVEVVLEEGGGHGVAVEEDEGRVVGEGWGGEGTEGVGGEGEGRLDTGQDVGLGEEEVGAGCGAEEVGGEALGLEEEGGVRGDAQEAEDDGYEKGHGGGRPGWCGGLRRTGRAGVVVQAESGAGWRAASEDGGWQRAWRL